VQGAYERTESGELRGPAPRRCPLGEDGSECRVGFHGTRVRKTGPRIPVTVMRCHGHEVSFTVYPPGHVPYGRVAVLAVDLEGRQVESARGDAAESALANTVWEAVEDAARGERWEESGAAGLRGSRRTQGRRLELCARLFGLVGPERERERERLAEVVGVPALMLHEVYAREYVGRGRGRWKARGQAVLKVLGVCLAGGVPGALLAAGYIAGLWGRPSRWDPGGGQLHWLA